MVCPQHAKSYLNDLEPIRHWLKDPAIHTAVSLAPSYFSAFGKQNGTRLLAALRQMGFDIIQETAIGAAHVTAAYIDLLQRGDMHTILTTCCPTVNAFVSKYYPDLLPLLAPVLSPMQAHGKLIKEYYGSDTKVIFIGPCLSKIDEAAQSQFVDGVISFEQLAQWLEQEKIQLDSLPEGNLDNQPTYSSIYPIPTGILSDIRKSLPQTDYAMLSIDGLENLKELFEEIRAGEIEHAFIEVNACTGGCINGPLMPQRNHAPCKARMEIAEHAEMLPAGISGETTDISCRYESDEVRADIPGERKIREILAQIGKPSPEFDLNCGSCGYPTCRDKAIAVYQGKAELYMCMPYMNEISQTLSNVVISASPNYIIAVDDELKIKEINAAAQKLFRTTRAEALDRYLVEFIDPLDFLNVISEKRSILDKKVTYSNIGVSVELSVTYVPGQNLAIGIMKDITAEEKLFEQRYKMKMESVEMAQKVIDKQMTVAQEIASLLGETTAETKVTLNKLKEMIRTEGQES